MFIHHVAVDAASYKRLLQFLESYEYEHPGSIKSHAVGFLGKNYLVYAHVDLSAELKHAGFMCRVVDM